MNRRNLLKALLLAPLARLLPKTKVEKEPTELEPNDTPIRIVSTDSACYTFTTSSNVDTFTLYGLDSEGKAYIINQET